MEAVGQQKRPPPPPLLFDTTHIQITPATPIGDDNNNHEDINKDNNEDNNESDEDTDSSVVRPTTPLPPVMQSTQRSSYTAAVNNAEEPQYARVQIRSPASITPASPIVVLKHSKQPLVDDDGLDFVDNDNIAIVDDKENNLDKEKKEEEGDKEKKKRKKKKGNEETRRVSRESNRYANDALQSLVSALYCKLLVILGLAFPMAEVVVEAVPTGYYQLFYVYLFVVSLFFLLYLYIAHILSRRNRDLNKARVLRNGEEEEQEERRSRSPQYGSFYLRMGAVLFGGGGMIYNGIEIGSYLEMNLDADCENLFTVVKPALQMLFVFAQMYFIFIFQNNDWHRVRFISRLGLMHMLATNLCVWLNVLILETGHEIRHQQGHHEALPVEHNQNYRLEGSHAEALTLLNASRGCKSISEPLLMRGLMHDSAPFLFPCLIEYSLICAAVLFVMWKHVGKNNEKHAKNDKRIIQRQEYHINTSQYSVDCSQSHTGLFLGILVLVLTIISLIVFFVLINSTSNHLRDSAIIVASVSELVLYTLATLAVLLGMCEVRKLYYENCGQKLELDQLLLIVAQTGVFVYAAFCLIGAFFQLEDHATAFLASLATMVQTCLQTIFILDASSRFVFTPKQVHRKPGREVVTFLLVCNLAMWAINTLETNRADSHPIQLRFYGADWAWPVITHISMPLAIFYRFHSTVCLCEIWKNTYKYRAHRMAKV